MVQKTDSGRYFEDFKLGDVLRHPVPRTLTQGDQSLYLALFGGRFPLYSSAEAARRLGFGEAPVEDWLAFHVVFGKSVPDVSINAVANLGYAQGRFLAPVMAGDTLSATSTVIGLKETSNGETGVVYVRTQGVNQNGLTVIDYVRWVLVRKRDFAAKAPEPTVPDLAEAVAASDLVAPDGLDGKGYDPAWTGSTAMFEDYAIGERIDHVDGMTIEEAEHQMATRLYQNNAKVHFNAYQERQGRFAKRLIYGGHVISLARALSYNGLGNALTTLAINGGRHVAPCFAGDTVFAWSEIVDKAPLWPARKLGALRVKLRAAKDHPCADFPLTGVEGKAHPKLILDLDLWLAMPMQG